MTDKTGYSNLILLTPVNWYKHSLWEIVLALASLSQKTQIQDPASLLPEISPRKTHAHVDSHTELECSQERCS